MHHGTGTTTTVPVHGPENESSTGLQCLPRMIQLIRMGPGLQSTSVHAQNPDWFHNVKLPKEEETETWGGNMKELTSGGKHLMPKKHLGTPREGSKTAASLDIMWDSTRAFSSLPPPQATWLCCFRPQGPTEVMFGLVLRGSDTPQMPWRPPAVQGVGPPGGGTQTGL